MHREVVALIEAGMTGPEVLDDFVARHGELVLMAPRKQGFNLVGYVLPGMAITIVGAVMLWMLARRTRQVAADEADGESVATSGVSEEDAERLKAELADLDS
jgi:cytochrome c-type biogenesis protein CcmH/NrfF